jgi:hypothetical protein
MRVLRGHPGAFSAARIVTSPSVAAPCAEEWRRYLSHFLLGRSAVVRHHSAGPLGFTRLPIGRFSREFLDSVQGFLAQGRRLAHDSRLAQPFDVGDSSIECVYKLA